MNLLIILGTKRNDNYSQHVANFIYKIAKQDVELEPTLVNPKDFNLSIEGFYEANNDTEYKNLVKEADAYLVVSPEYNHGYSGTLKNLLDTAFKEYKHKPFALAGVSNGPWGGTRGIHTLLPVIRKLGVLVSTEDLFFPHIDSLVDNNKLETDETADRIRQTLTELKWLAKTLKYGVENFQNKYHTNLK